MLLRRSILHVSLLGLVAFLKISPSAAQANVEVKIDVVAALQLLIDSIKEITLYSDKKHAEAVKQAIPNIISTILEISSIKDQFQKRYEEGLDKYAESTFSPDMQMKHIYDDESFLYSLRPLTIRLSELVRNLQDLLLEIDPEWRTKNVTTLAALYEETMMRGQTLAYVQVLIDGRGDTEEEEMYYNPKETKKFFMRQKAEAEELRRLASQLAASVASLP